MMENKKQIVVCAHEQAYESNTNILELPNDCILLILNYISLRDVLTCRQVCHQWLYSVQKFGQGLHTLRLFHNFFPEPDSVTYFKTLFAANLQDNPEYAFNRSNTLVLKPKVNDDKLHSAAMHICRWRKGKKDYGGRFLAKLFPNVHNLVLSFVFHHGHRNEHHFYMDHAYLLRKWRHSLQCLTVFGQPSYLNVVVDENEMNATVENQKEHQKSIYGALNKCVNLKRLHLFNFDENSDCFDLDQCPALHTQLEAYSWSDCHGFAPIQKSQLSTVKCLTVVRGKDIFNNLTCEMFQNVTKLSLNSEYFTERNVLPFCSYFTNLVYLDISSCQFSHPQESILKNLVKLCVAKLPKLVHLKLSAFLILNDLIRLTQQELCTIPKVPSITTLHLVDTLFFMLKHCKPLHYEFLSDKFPSVRAIHISCIAYLHKEQFKAKMKKHFLRHFGTNRLSEIKFFKFTRMEDFDHARQSVHLNL